MNEWLPLPFGDSFIEGWANQHPWLHLIFIRLPIALAPALFTLFLPRLLRYRPGGMAVTGGFISLLLCVLLLWGQCVLPEGRLYGHLHPWLYGVFYLYAWAGVALCTVGIFDRKRSAIWAMAAILSLTLSALHDTCVWFGMTTGKPWVPMGFLLFGICLVTGFVRRRADPAATPDLRTKDATTGNNRTRRSRSISRRLLREGEIHWLPVYWIILGSDMAREGILNSGSYRFADHIYRSEASGRGRLGCLLDRRLLNLPASRAFRLRYLKAKEAMQESLEGKKEQDTLRILAIPCGLPRDFSEWAEGLERSCPEVIGKIEYHGMDLDKDLLRQARGLTQDLKVGSMHFHQGNALNPDEFPNVIFDLVISTGLGEFLKDEKLKTFYANVYRVLKTGGSFYTSATSFDGRSDRFLRVFELDTEYRNREQLEALLRGQPWSQIRVCQDEFRLQTFVCCTK